MTYQCSEEFLEIHKKYFDYYLKDNINSFIETSLTYGISWNTSEDGKFSMESYVIPYKNERIKINKQKG